METHYAINKTDTFDESDSPVKGTDELHISDATVIAALAIVALALIIAICVTVWKCFTASNRHRVPRPTVMRINWQHNSLDRMPVDKADFLRLLHKYNSVGNDSDIDVCLSPKLEEKEHSIDRQPTPKRRMKWQSSTPSLETSPPERFRKSSGSSFGIPHRLSPSDCKNASFLSETSPAILSDDHLLEEPVFTSPLGQYNFRHLWKINKYKDSALVRSPAHQVSVSSGHTNNSEPPELKRFYFAWPEEEEEEESTNLWSPVILKLASLERSKNETSTDVQKVSRTETICRSSETISSKMITDKNSMLNLKHDFFIPAGLKNTWV